MTFWSVVYICKSLLNTKGVYVFSNLGRIILDSTNASSTKITQPFCIQVLYVCDGQKKHLQRLDFALSNIFFFSSQTSHGFLLMLCVILLQPRLAPSVMTKAWRLFPRQQCRSAKCWSSARLATARAAWATHCWARTSSRWAQGCGPPHRRLNLPLLQRETRPLR